MVGETFASASIAPPSGAAYRLPICSSSITTNPVVEC
jgi:hypothetical protein